jgi:hypothetical protein
MKDLIKKILKEGNDFDWTKDIEPISKSEIAGKLSGLEDFGYYIHNEERNLLVKSIYNLGLNSTQLDALIESLYSFGDSCFDSGRDQGSQDAWSDGHSEGYNEGYDDGQDEMRGNLDDARDEGYEDGYDKGYNEGESEGYAEGYKKGYEEGSEETYYKAFEEGRAYEAGVEVEDLERMESGFDPREYDEDYDENY